MKTCTKCGEQKPLTEFYKDIEKKDGLQSNCKSCRAAYYAANKDRKAAQQAEYYAANKDHIAARQAEYYAAYYAANKDRIAARQADYYAANPDKFNAKNAKRRSAKLQRTPPWLTQEHLEQIANFYKLSKHMTEITGEQHHVDHIIPLQGANVSGLHVPWNLQVIPAKINLSKNNRLMDNHADKTTITPIPVEHAKIWHERAKSWPVPSSRNG